MTQEYAVFGLSEATFALEVDCVREVLRAATLSPALDVDCLEGRLNLRGVVIPVIDVRRLLKLAPHPLAASDLLIVVEVDSIQIALRTEHNVRLEAVEESTIEAGNTDELICGILRIGQHIVSILNARHLLALIKE